MCILNRYYDSKVLRDAGILGGGGWAAKCSLTAPLPFAGKGKGGKVRFVFQQLVFKVP